MSVRPIAGAPDPTVPGEVRVVRHRSQTIIDARRARRDPADAIGNATMWFPPAMMATHRCDGNRFRDRVARMQRRNGAHGSPARPIAQLKKNRARTR